MIISKEILVNMQLRADTADSESCITPISHAMKICYSILLIIIECYYDASHTSYAIIFVIILSYYHMCYYIKVLTSEVHILTIFFSES